MNKIEISLFDKHIADLYRDGDRFLLKQYDNGAYLASPILMPSDNSVFDSTSLTFLDRVPGFVSDSLPGHFGNEILKGYFEQENDGTSPTVIDKLLFIGDRGMGALSFSPHRTPAINEDKVLKLKDMFDKAREMKYDRAYDTLHDALVVASHSFAGGARAKAVVSLDMGKEAIHLGHRNIVPKGCIPAIIKYDDTVEGSEDKSVYSRLEYIYYKLATQAGIKMSECYLLSSDGRDHFVTRRFDLNNGKRSHVHSLAGLLHKDYNYPMLTSYEELLLTGRKLNVPHDSIKHLFSQMLFNYMFVNQDDHSRNFSFMTDDDFKWRATPAYDITYAKGAGQTSEHQLSLYGKTLSKIDFKDVVRLAGAYSISSEWMAEMIENMLELREKRLPTLLKEYEIPSEKQKRIIKEVSERDFQGALNG